MSLADPSVPLVGLGMCDILRPLISFRVVCERERVWVLQEADIKVELEAQKIYWGKQS